MTAEMNAKLNELMNNEEYVTRLMDAGSVQGVQEMLAAEGVEITEEEIAQAAQEAQKILKQDGELSEEQLEQVSGGMCKKIMAIGFATAAIGLAMLNPGVIMVGGLVVLTGMKVNCRC